MKASDPRQRQFAAAAEQFIGARFLLHGRDPALGLDCVGLVCVSLSKIGKIPYAPDGYGLRNSAFRQWFKFAELSGFEPVSGSVATGDLVATNSGPEQIHLIIAESERVGIHAHAGLKRVVRQPIVFQHAPIIAHWRLP